MESEVSCASVSHTGVADGAPPDVTYLPSHVPSLGLVFATYTVKLVVGLLAGFPFSLLVKTSEEVLTVASVGADGVDACVYVVLAVLVAPVLPRESRAVTR
jgi:hypothetical protein